MILFVVIVATIVGLLLGFMWGRRSFGEQIDFGLANDDGTFGPRFAGDQFFRIVPESLWADVVLARYATSPVNSEPFLPARCNTYCTRESCHEGPCNGWPCPEVAERMRAE